MKKSKVLVSCLVSSLLAASLAIPSQAATASFTPSATNFTPVFDFDKTPTAQYTDGYKPGVRNDLIGDSKTKKCITADGIGFTYDLTIAGNGGYSGKALKLDVLDAAPEDGTYNPVGLNPAYGENKLPGTPDGYTATDFMFWVDCTGFKDTSAPAGTAAAKGILTYFQAKDYDKDGNEMTELPNAFWPKTNDEGGYWQVEDGNGGWKNMPMNASNKDHDFYIPNTYKGWVKIPLSNFELVSGGSWEQTNANGIIDTKAIEQISLGMGNYKKQAGSTVLFDEFGFMMKSNTPDPEPTDSTTAPTGADNKTTAAPVSTPTSGKDTKGGSDETGKVANPKTGAASSAAAAAVVFAAGAALAVSRKHKG